MERRPSCHVLRGKNVSVTDCIFYCYRLVQSVKACNLEGARLFTLLSTCLEGPAYLWYCSWEEANPEPTLEAFVTAFKERFLGPKWIDELLRERSRLRLMSENLLAAREFSVQFAKFTTCLPKHERDPVHEFALYKEALPFNLKRAVILSWVTKWKEGVRVVLEWCSVEGKRAPRCPCEVSQRRPNKRDTELIPNQIISTNLSSATQPTLCDKKPLTAEMAFEILDERSSLRLSSENALAARRFNDRFRALTESLPADEHTPRQDLVQYRLALPGDLRKQIARLKTWQEAANVVEELCSCHFDPECRHVMQPPVPQPKKKAPKKKSIRPVSEITCFRCHNKGHYVSSCTVSLPSVKKVGN